MATFSEIQLKLNKMEAKKVILECLIEYVDSTFRPVAGGEPKKLLLMDSPFQVPVPAEDFESVVIEMTQQVNELKSEIENVMTSVITTTPKQTKKSKDTGDTK